MIFETHGHYDDTQFDEDREQLIAEFLEKDIDKVMNVGADMQSSRNSVELAAKYPHFYAAVGVHPSEVGELTETDIQELKSMVLDNPKVRAIGEIGLDYHLMMILRGMFRRNGFSGSLSLRRSLPCRSLYTAVMRHQTLWRCLKEWMAAEMAV